MNDIKEEILDKVSFEGDAPNTYSKERATKAMRLYGTKIFEWVLENRLDFSIDTDADADELLIEFEDDINSEYRKRKKNLQQ